MAQDKIDLIELFSTDESIDERLRNKFLNVIKGNSVRGFDYIKFKASVEKMKEMGMDEETAYKSAFATASIMGLTKETLLQSILKTKNSLDEEKVKFAQALKKQITKKIDGEDQEVKRLKKEIENRKAQIKTMLNEIEILEKRIKNSDELKIKNKDKIDAKKQVFISTFEAVYSHLVEDEKLIKQYL